MPGGGVNTLRDLLELWFGDKVRTRDAESDVTVGTSVVALAAPNPQRIKLSIFNWGGLAIAIGFSNTVTATTGLGIAPNTGLSLVWTTDLDDPAEGIFAISSGAGNAVHVVEQILIGDRFNG